MISPSLRLRCNTDRGDEERFTSPAPVAPSACLDGVRILLAEDGIDNQRLISLVLRKAGAVVEIVDDGRQAVDLVLATFPRVGSHGKTLQPAFDVVLMDIQMPEMDGFTATQILRDAGYESAIVALTAHAMTSDRAKCLSAGFDDYATKPIDRERLLETIARHAAGPNERHEPRTATRVEDAAH
jgi:Amt family ammonium transporter